MEPTALPYRIMLHQLEYYQVKILRLLDLPSSVELRQELEALFVGLNQDDLDKSSAYDRIKCIDSVYRLFIKQSKQQKDVSFYDAINNGLGDYYNVNTMLQDFNYVIRNGKILIQAERKLVESDSNDAICSAVSCLSITRNYRDRNIFGRGGVDIINELYDVKYGHETNDANDNDTKLYEINIGDIMDTIHIELYHTIRIVPDEITEKEQELKYEQEQTEVGNVKEDDDGLYDRYCDAVSSIIRVKSKSARFNRGDKDRYGKGGGNKFMTIANQQNIIHQTVAAVSDDAKDDDDNKTALAAYQASVYDNNKLTLQMQKEKEAEVISHQNIDEETMLDAVFDEVKCELRKVAAKPGSILYSTLEDYILAEQFDSDPFCEDLMDNDNGETSNIIKYLRDKYSEYESFQVQIELISSVCNSMAYGVNIFGSEYQPGYRYFYWDYYKNLNIEENPVYRTRTNWTHESNPGYLISDWYIPAKWSSLKEEATNNVIAPYSTKEFELTWNKAKLKLEAYQSDPNHKPLSAIASYVDWEKLYGIKKGDRPSTEHICALLMYTNFTRNCTAFSATYRRKTGYETNRKLKERHSNVAIQGRLLRELIEGYGQTMDMDDFPEYKNINYFYHGVNKSMIFQSTGIKLCGPVSTSSDFVISATNFAQDGIVLSIIHDDVYNPFMDCGVWSDFSNEREYLFLGGLEALYVNSIRDIPTNTNYGKFIEAITMLHEIQIGAPITSRQPTKGDMKCLFHLIVDNIIGIDSYLSFGASLKDIGMQTYSKKKTPIFITNLFRHFVINVKKVEINLAHLKVKKYSEGQFGYKSFLPLLSQARSQSRPNIKLFLSVYHNLQQFVIFIMVYSNGWDYGSTIDLDDDLCNDLLDGITTMQKRNKKSSLKYIAITKPKGSIAHFIDSHKEKFNQINFKLYCDKYTHSFFGSCDECLYIAPNIQ